MPGNIQAMLDSVPGVRKDWKEDWVEDAKADWKIDWLVTPPAPPAPVLIAPINTSMPVISGDAKVGSTLTVSAGTWTGAPAPTITYQWSIDGTAVPGATTASYLVQPHDATFMAVVAVTATNAAGVDTVIASAGPVAP